MGWLRATQRILAPIHPCHIQWYSYIGYPFPTYTKWYTHQPILTRLYLILRFRSNPHWRRLGLHRTPLRVRLNALLLDPGSWHRGRGRFPGCILSPIRRIERSAGPSMAQDCGLCLAASFSCLVLSSVGLSPDPPLSTWVRWYVALPHPLSHGRERDWSGKNRGHDRIAGRLYGWNTSNEGAMREDHCTYIGVRSQRNSCIKSKCQILLWVPLSLTVAANTNSASMVAILYRYSLDHMRNMSWRRDFPIREENLIASSISHSLFPCRVILRTRYQIVAKGCPWILRGHTPPQYSANIR